MNKQLVIIGYSGHSYVCLDVAISCGYTILGYCDKEEKTYNPYKLNYLGKDLDRKCLDYLEQNDFFFGIGNNQSRCNAMDDIARVIKKSSISLISDRTYISPMAVLDKHGILVMQNVTINSLATISQGCIINTGAIIEHECIVADFAHIGPGAVLAGNVTVGELSFIGANAVVKQGVTIGKNCTIGAGTVVLMDVPDGATVVGNPGKVMKLGSI